MALLPVTRLETADGDTNVAPIFDANTNALELIFNPVHDDHLNDGSAADVANVVRDRIFGDEPEPLTGTTIALDFKTEPHKQFYDVAAGITFSVSNLGPGRFVFLTLRAQSATGPHTLTWPSDTVIRWLGSGGAPTALNVKYMLIKLWVTGGASSSTLVLGEVTEES